MFPYILLYLYKPENFVVMTKAPEMKNCFFPGIITVCNKSSDPGAFELF